jgi:hypothetical protein
MHVAVLTAHEKRCQALPEDNGDSSSDESSEEE